MKTVRLRSGVKLVYHPTDEFVDVCVGNTHLTMQKRIVAALFKSGFMEGVASSIAELDKAMFKSPPEPTFPTKGE